MQWCEHHYLSVIVFFPLFWGLVALLFQGKDHKIHRTWALVGTLLTFLISLRLIAEFPTSGMGFRFIEQTPWISELGVSYFLAVDGISLWLIVLTTFLMPLAVLGSFNSITEQPKRFYFLLMVLETAMLGAFCALDLFLFYVFWEAMLIPLYFIVGIWGGKDRIYAAMKLFLYTMTGSVLMLVAIFYLGWAHRAQMGAYSFSLIDLTRLSLPGQGWFSPQSILFLAFAIAFAIKVPLFPLHTWLPDAHVQAPTAGSVILAGVLLKMGGYGFLRITFPLFPEAVYLYHTPLMCLGAIAIVYGACVAYAQTDIKKLVAYSSVSHMGYVILGIFSLTATGISGAVFQMLAHGISTGGLFLMVGMIYERAHTRELNAFGGLLKVLPHFSALLIFISLSSIALPGTNGFVGEFLVLLGAWQESPWLSVVGSLGAILGAVYMLGMIEKVLLGKVQKEFHFSDLKFREFVILGSLVVMILWMGIYPRFFLDRTQNGFSTFSKEYASEPHRNRLP